LPGVNEFPLISNDVFITAESQPPDGQTLH
jgi:hypothetical protein